MSVAYSQLETAYYGNYPTSGTIYKRNESKSMLEEFQTHVATWKYAKVEILANGVDRFILRMKDSQNNVKDLHFLCRKYREDMFMFNFLTEGGFEEHTWTYIIKELYIQYSHNII